MKQIIKSQCYQLVRTKLIYVVLFLLLFMQCTIMLGEVEYPLYSGVVLVGDYIADCGAEISCVAAIFAFLFTAQICGADFLDKTTNYEVMSGHERKDVYFGRAIVSIIGGTIGSMLIMAFPVIVGCIIGQWGDSISFGDVLLRYILSVFPIIRMICEFVFLTYLIKNSYVVMAIGFFAGMYGPFLVLDVVEGPACFLGISSLVKMYDFSAWSTFTLVGEKTITIYDAAIKVGEVVPIILASVIIGGLFLLLGYHYFKKDDLS